MRRTIAAGVVLVALLVGAWVPAAHAGRAKEIVFGLPLPPLPFVPPVVVAHPRHERFHRAVVAPRVVVAPPVVVERPVVYPARPVYAAPVYAAPAPVAQPSVIEYPHGRYELHYRYGQYVWVWIPTVPTPPPPPPPPYAPAE
jgi:hypothetical protein